MIASLGYARGCLKKKYVGFWITVFRRQISTYIYEMQLQACINFRISYVKDLEYHSKSVEDKFETA